MFLAGSASLLACSFVSEDKQTKEDGDKVS